MSASESYQRLAVEAAAENVDNRIKVGAVVVKGGRVLGRASNRGPRHAEARALDGIWHSEIAGATLFVARPLYCKNPALGMARPCPNCEKMLRDLGVAKVVYTNWSGEWVFERW